MSQPLPAPPADSEQPAHPTAHLTREAAAMPAERDPETGAYLFAGRVQPMPTAPPGHGWTAGDVAAVAMGQPPRWPAAWVPVESVPAVEDVGLDQDHSNVDLSGVNHFARQVDGEDGLFCGGCTAPWPCETFTGLRAAEHDRPREQQGYRDARKAPGDAVAAAAALLGLEPSELARRLT